MENPSLSLFIALVTFTAVISLGNSQCDEYKCRLPQCRCWDDPSRPGNFSDEGTPQIVALSFAFAINKHTVSLVMPLFKGLINPNACPIKGTFFSGFANTDEATIKQLYKEGHEFGLTSADGTIPKTRRQWVESLFQSSEKLYDAGISRDEIKGGRSPNLHMGGNDEIRAEMQFGMNYEASCVYKFDPQRNEKDKHEQTPWPYTYDNVRNTPKCDIGVTPNQTFPGFWQFLVPEMKFKGQTCATLSSCSPYINTTADAFTLLYNSFERHYYKSRAPFVLYIDLQWMTRPMQVQGLKEFLESIGRFEDTWMVTLSQALEWVKYPVPMYKTVKFMPWECSDEVKAANMKYLQRQ